MLGLYLDNGTENGNYSSSIIRYRVYRVNCLVFHA